MPTAGEQPPAPLERTIAVGKDLVSLLRDGALLVLAFLLIAFPAAFNSLLLTAGFREGSIAGFRWEAILDSDDALRDAQATIASLQDQLEKTTGALVEAQTASADPSLQQKLERLAAENRQLKTASTGVAASVRSTLASNEPLVEKAQSVLGATNGWAVVFGSDVSLEAARDEIARAARKGIPEAGVYLRNGYYASIAVVDDRSKAQEYLGIAKGFRPDAYIASMASWCRNPRPGDGYVSCERQR